MPKKCQENAINISFGYLSDSKNNSGDQRTFSRTFQETLRRIGQIRGRRRV